MYWICTDHYFSQVNGRIATKLAHDGLRVGLSLRPQCAQGQRQGQRSRDTGTFCTGTKIASSRLLGYVELFIIRVKFAIYYFLHFNTVRQVAARLRAKSAIYDCLVALCKKQQREVASFNLDHPVEGALSSRVFVSRLVRSYRNGTWYHVGLLRRGLWILWYDELSVLSKPTHNCRVESRRLCERTRRRSWPSLQFPVLLSWQVMT